MYLENPELDQFLHGDCPIFAVALHRLTGYPIYGLVEFDEVIGHTVLIHAYVKAPDGKLIDASGDESTVETILDVFPNNGESEEITMTDKQVLKIGYGKQKKPDVNPVILIAESVFYAIRNEELDLS
jgi:hypothetical protein